MHYSYEFKKNCIDLYRKGVWANTPNGIKDNRFRQQIREWVRIEDACGTEALRRKSIHREWTAEQRYSLVAQVLAGKSILEVALSNGIRQGQLHRWVRKYQDLGYNGLENMKKGRPSKESQMKKKSSLTPLNESEREELIRLRAETEYLKAENAVIKKRIALRQEKEDARLKAKKQQSSKNSAAKDTN